MTFNNIHRLIFFAFPVKLLLLLLLLLLSLLLLLLFVVVVVVVDKICVIICQTLQRVKHAAIVISCVMTPHNLIFAQLSDK